MSYYREIPANVEAIPVPDPNTTSATAEAVQEAADWCNGTVLIYIDANLGPVRVISIPGLDGFARPGDYIVKSETGAFIVCPPSVFPTLYEPVAG